MAWMNQEKKAQIVAAVKPILARYKLKASFSVDNHSSIVVHIKSGKIDFFTNYSDCMRSQPGRRQDIVDDVVSRRYMDVNQYWFQEHFSGTALQCMDEIFKAIKTAGGWYDKSDIQTDYFDTAFYINVKIGKWNKPYILE